MNNNPVGQICPYCQFPIKPGEAVLFCSACGLAHHRQCWQENGKCTTFGCEGHALDNATHSYPAGRQNANCIDLTTDDLSCSKCGTSNAMSAAFCARCGANLSESQQAANHVFCRRCGTKNSAAKHVCANCSASLHSAPYTPPPQAATTYNPTYPGNTAPGWNRTAEPSYTAAGVPANIDNHMVFAILTTLFCCLPLGVVSIVYASQVNGKIQVGDYAGAITAANNAKTWCWVSLGSGILIAIVALLGH